jgi:hypothetical protein
MVAVLMAVGLICGCARLCDTGNPIDDAFVVLRRQMGALS